METWEGCLKKILFFILILFLKKEEAAFRLLERLPDIELYILSCVFQDSHSESDKKQGWQSILIC